MRGYLRRVFQAVRVALPEVRSPFPGFGKHRVTVWRRFDVAPARAWEVLSDWRAPYISASGTGFVVSQKTFSPAQHVSQVQFYTRNGVHNHQVDGDVAVGATRDMECKGHPRVATAHSFRQELVEFDPARMFFAYKNITPLFLYPVGFPVAKYGCRVAVADQLPPRRNRSLVRWTAWFNEVDASESEVRAGLQILYGSYLDAAAELMALEPEARRRAVAELEKRMRSAQVEARTEAEEAPASDVRHV